MYGCPMTIDKQNRSQGKDMGWGGSPAEPLGPGSSIEFRLDARSGVPTYL